MNVYRQGDILFAPVATIPERAQKLPGLVVARGEITGHSHTVMADGLAELYEQEGTMFLRVAGSPAQVVHEEHHTLHLPEGMYKVWRQREYDPSKDERLIED